MALQLQVSVLIWPRRDGKNCFWLRPRKDNHPDGGGRGRGGGGGGMFGERRGWRGMCVWEGVLDAAGTPVGANQRGHRSVSPFISQLESTSPH